MIKLNLFTPSAQEIKDSRKRKSLKKGSQPSCTLPYPYSALTALLSPYTPFRAIVCHPFPPKPPAVLDSMNNTLTYETTSSAHHRYPSASHRHPIGRHLINTPSALHQRPIGILSTPRGTHFAGSLGDSVAQVEDCLDYFKQRVKYFFKTKQDFIPQGKNRQHA